MIRSRILVFAAAQLIMRLEAGGYIAAPDHRKDGQAAGYQAVHGH